MWFPPEVYANLYVQGADTKSETTWFCGRCEVGGQGERPLRCFCCGRFVKSGVVPMTTGGAQRYSRGVDTVSSTAGTISVGEELDVLV